MKLQIITDTDGIVRLVKYFDSEANRGKDCISKNLTGPFFISEKATSSDAHSYQVSIRSNPQNGVTGEQWKEHTDILYDLLKEITSYRRAIV